MLSSDEDRGRSLQLAARKYETGTTASRESVRPAPIDLPLARSLYERGCELDAKSWACAGALRMDEAACGLAPGGPGCAELEQLCAWSRGTEAAAGLLPFALIAVGLVWFFLYAAQLSPR